MTSFMATTVLNTKITETENKKLDASDVVSKTFLNTKISEIENKIPDNSKYITTHKFNKLKVENFTARLKHADLVNKIGFDNLLTSWVTSNITNIYKFKRRKIV